MNIEENNITFTFSEQMTVTKFDDTKFYRESYNKLPNCKGVDIIADSGEMLQLIEVKNCSGHEAENAWRTSVNNSKLSSAPLTIDVEGYKLNIRAAVVIIHNGRVLVHRNTESNHYALLGGRVKIDEDSETTVKREVKEELGKEIEIIGYVSTIENFFEMKDKKYHEIEFVYKAEFINEEDEKIEYNLKNIEGEDWIKYEWLELDKIDLYPLKPKVIKDVLKENKFPVHKINKDMI